MKSQRLQQNLVAFVVGVLFAAGLAVSGMTQPQKIIHFLTVGTDWDPSLLFVMLGALAVHLIAYPLIRRRRSPIFDQMWHVPTRQDVNTRLLLGSALFGLGWGLAGYCPGPALTSLASVDVRSFVFVGAMVIGMLLFKKTESLWRLQG